MEEIVSDTRGWNCSMEFNISLTADKDPKYIAICTILKGNIPYQLPTHFHSLESKKRLLTELKISAMKCDFALAHHSSKYVKQLDILL